jgi:hypothetical protein
MSFFKNIITDARRPMGTMASVAGIDVAAQPDWPASPTATAPSETTETPVTTGEAGNPDTSERQVTDHRSDTPGREREHPSHNMTLQSGWPRSPERADRETGADLGQAIAPASGSPPTDAVPITAESNADETIPPPTGIHTATNPPPRGSDAPPNPAATADATHPPGGFGRFPEKVISTGLELPPLKKGGWGGFPPVASTHKASNPLSSPFAEGVDGYAPFRGQADQFFSGDHLKPATAGHVLPESPVEMTQAAHPDRPVNRPAAAGSQPAPESPLPPPFIPGREIPFPRSPGVRRQPPEPAAPQVQIGQIDVIVEAPTAAKAPSDRPRQTVDLASRLYLRGL